VCIFARKDQCFKKIDILYQVLKICAVKLEIETSNIIILSLYRALSGDFSQFIRRLDGILKYLCNPKSEFLICGDTNIDCLVGNNWKKTT
jgi:hypothetical protein